MNDIPPIVSTKSNGAHLDGLLSHAASEKFHPVIIFGGAASGKTAMIMSLLRFLLVKPNGVGALLDPNFFPPDYPDRNNRIIDARQYIEQLLQDFLVGNTRKSSVVRPLFLPLTITAGQPIETAEDHIRIVLVDGNGEWFETNDTTRGSDGSWTKDFEPELHGLVTSQRFPSLTTIFVSPHSTDNQGTVPLGKVTAGLASIIAKYRTVREDESRDHNLFLFTKWDRHASAKRRDAMWKPEMARLDRDLRERARDAWAAYYNGETPPYRQRYFMQYVSMFGDRNGNNVAMPQVGSDDDLILDHYSKILLNWIYANASEATWETRVSLFPDVDAYRDERMPVYDRVLGWIAGARS